MSTPPDKEIWPSVVAAIIGFLVFAGLGQLIGLHAIGIALALGWIWVCILQIADLDR